MDVSRMLEPAAAAAVQAMAQAAGVPPAPYYSAQAQAMVKANAAAKAQARGEVQAKDVAGVYPGGEALGHAARAQQQAQQQAQTQAQSQAPCFTVTIPAVPASGEGKAAQGEGKGGVAGGTLEATFRVGDYIPRFDLRAVCTALWTPGAHPDQIKKRMNKARAALFEGMLMERPPVFPIQGGIGPGRKSMSYGVAALGFAFLVMQTRGFSKEQKAELSKELGTLVNLAPLPVAAKKGGGAVAADPAPWEEKGVLRKLLVAAETGGDEGFLETAKELRYPPPPALQGYLAHRKQPTPLGPP